MPSFRPPLSDSARRLAFLLKGPLGISFDLLVEHALRERFPPRSDSPPPAQRRKRARSWVSRGIKELVEARRVAHRKVVLSEAVPAPQLIFDSNESPGLPADFYCCLVRHWVGHSGRVPVELVAPAEHYREIEQINDRYRSESISAALLLASVFLALSKPEMGSWKRESCSIEAADKDDRRYFEVARYEQADGQRVVICAGMVGHWLLGQAEGEADAGNVMGVLRGLLNECRETRSRLQIWAPEPILEESIERRIQP